MSRARVFVMYILWWNKPLLPNEPFILDGDWVEPLCAYMYMSSDLSGEVEKKESQTTIKTMFAFLNWYSATPEIELISLRLPKMESEGTVETEGKEPSQMCLQSYSLFNLHPPLRRA